MLFRVADLGHPGVETDVDEGCAARSSAGLVAVLQLKGETVAHSIAEDLSRLNIVAEVENAAPLITLDGGHILLAQG